MIRVSNKKCIRNLSRKSLSASRTRNIVAVLAIALTALLFTALFTIALSINDAIQESNFRLVGGFSHGTFKYLTKEEFAELRNDPLISDWGVNRYLGMPLAVPFNKNQVEIGFSDKKQAHWSYCDPAEGRLPQEGTLEAATDLEVLKLLGVEPELGAEFTMTFDVAGKETTQKFVLCGWWEKDKIAIANHVLIPESRVNEVLDELSIALPAEDEITGSYNLDVMFKNADNIEENLKTILADHGYQAERKSADLPFIAIGVNWGYTDAQLDQSMEPVTVVAMTAILLLIILTGYLIIYNVFQISVVGDIRFYGLLKTIGTTGKQIRCMIRQQALLLGMAGVPIGLLLGWLTGAKLTPVVLRRLNGVPVDVVSVNPLIFLISALFALVTVVISCNKPGRMAARISPVEAVRYTEINTSKKTIRKGEKGVSLFHMAKANMGRSRRKTVVTILSLSLSVVLLNATFLFANGLDMDKYLSAQLAGDFVVADAGYFQTGSIFSEEQVVGREVMDSILMQGGITDGGRIYGQTGTVKEFLEEDYFRKIKGRFRSSAEVEQLVKRAERSGDGKVADTTVQLYGMEPYALGKLHVLDGDLSKLYDPGAHYLAAVYVVDDYGNPEMDSHWAKTGDKVTLGYEDREVEYEVAALVEVPHSLSYRYYMGDEFVLNDQTFLQEIGEESVMLYAFDTTEEAKITMGEFLKEYTGSVNPLYDYESKATYRAEFESLRSMYLLMGSTLSFVVGFIGILNFFNAILTGIIARKREFAMLQSIGMTGKQLKVMLVCEGLFYALGSVICALVLAVVMEPLLASAFGSIYWFFTYHLTIGPIFVIAPIFALLGCAIPLLVYRMVSKQTIVERLRETDN